MFIVGVTGGVATGKSSVSRVFKDLVVEPHKAAWKAIVSNFGKEILLPSGEIDREKLGKIVFEDGVKRRMLNKCTHPSIYKSICWKLFKSFITGEKFVILDLPLLYESGRAVLFLRKGLILKCHWKKSAKGLRLSLITPPARRGQWSKSKDFMTSSVNLTHTFHFAFLYF
ncbi:Dephospho-CoA kinase domain-containing protein [Acropora cervicornis]|uniref:Dephospho-CoA kinase domain-containing protein n=1 Tax=Acropora cervicornis TaxID=6130 RepID=A0AAD9QJK2_ACRCE|nr:Dephospho-CoA kinase domain-containing protein [Acropora cervicornis]